MVCCIISYSSMVWLSQLDIYFTLLVIYFLYRGDLYSGVCNMWKIFPVMSFVVGVKQMEMSTLTKVLLYCGCTVIQYG
eukprot:UN16386